MKQIQEIANKLIEMARGELSKKQLKQLKKEGMDLDDFHFDANEMVFDAVKSIRPDLCELTEQNHDQYFQIANEAWDLAIRNNWEIVPNNETFWRECLKLALKANDTTYAMHCNEMIAKLTKNP